MKIDAVVCVSDPDPYIFEKCIAQLLKQEYLNKIIIIHPNSDPFYYPQHKQIVILIEPKNSCLANARRMGIRNSQADFICFVDSDVLPHSNHFSNLFHAYNVYQKVFGISNIVIEGVLTIKDQQTNAFSLPYYPSQFKVLNPGERGFTHNTLIPRKAVLDWNPPFTCAFEDYSLTQHIISQKGKWIRYVQKDKSYHIKYYGLFKRNLWETAGERIVVNPSKKTIILRSITYAKRAIIHPFLLRNVRHAVSNIQIAISSLIGYFAYNNYIFLKKNE